MNRQTIVERARYGLYILLGFGLIYVLPMLGLDFAVDHGLYVAAGLVGASALRQTDPAEGVREPHTLSGAATEKVCECGHADYMHGNLFGCWSVRGDCGLECTCPEFSSAHLEESPKTTAADLSPGAGKNPLISQLAAADTLDDDPDNDAPIEVIADVEVDGVRLVLEEYLGKTTVGFTPPSGSVDFPLLDVEQIPALIDALTDMHRGWLHSGGAA